ncbi:hypothetical protein K431DRAFT_86436 [Polychaeton citri CBS 116435]|uniref:PHD-type domain-containing protein n=1 Tax=Polychaeton citri CBS 116435 TaxID=1314669 RepID=A0A9P4UPS1_9PEZI|nr:hypothetical protein K431DRAFT_86436 [Polychaeton citri CBS 116435]
MRPLKPDSISQNAEWEDSTEIRLARARIQVALLEEGEILNEHYCYGDYVRRRANFLGNLPEYRWRSLMTFESARRSAEQVFENDGSNALSVQEVRRREERLEEFPLLPLPTKLNTQTINDFLDYPNEEWIPPKTPEAKTPSYSPFRPHIVTPTRVASVVPSSVTTPGPPIDTPRTASRGFVNSEALSSSHSVFFETSPVAISDGQELKIKDMPTGRQLYANQNPTVAKPNGFFPERPVSPTEGSERQRLSTTSPILQDVSKALSQPPQSRQDSAHPDTAQVKPSLDIDDPQILRSIAQNEAILQDRQTTLRPSPRGAFISAYTNRGTTVPVKSQTRSKRPRPESSEEDAPFEIDPEPTTKPPRKSIKYQLKGIRLNRSKSKVTEVASSMDIAVPPRHSRRKQQNDEDSEDDDDTADTTTTLPLPKKQKGTIDLEDVIEGRSLPASIEQARAASAERRARLLEEHNARRQQQARGTARKTRVRNTEPDLMPEFFNVRNFPRSKRDETVRCICGQMDDDGKHMVSCDSCYVWEHTACIRDAAPEDLDDSAEETYLCRICDPWRHRGQLRKLRAGEPL